MRIEFQQSGGVAGIRRPVLTIDTASLPAEEAQRWHDLVDAADFFNLASAGPPAAARDAFSYRITVDLDGHTHTIQAHAGGATPALHTLIEHLRQAALPTPEK
jgi:hypothetical protein